MRARVSQPPHEVVRDELFANEITTDLLSFGLVMQVNVVHALLLIEAGALSRQQGRELVAHYAELIAAGSEDVQFDPDLEDLHLNIEQRAIRSVGEDVGGRMHTGRSRNDLNATTARMQTREQILVLAESLNGLRKVVLDRALEHKSSIMTGYTHLQPAQPITFGFYLAAIGDALARDCRRVQHAYVTANRSPLGAGALAGSGYPLDRARAATLLAFEGLIENALDAVASRDYMVELLAAAAALAVTVSRLAHDLQIWASSEFALIELSDATCIVSSIMPQKKNPITLEHCKGKTGHVVGSLVAALTAMHSTPFTNSRDVNREVPAALRIGLRETVSSIKLMTATLAGVFARTDHMLERSRTNFSTVTELADLLTRKYDIPFRSSHEIIAAVVRSVLEDGRDATAIDAAVVTRAAEKRGRGGLRLTEDDVRHALDPRRVIESRLTAGSPEPVRLGKMLNRMQKKLDEDFAWVDRCRNTISKADASVNQAISEVLGH